MKLQPIGGLTFKDEIPELVQADTSTEGDTAEPRLIIPLTSGKDSRDRTAGVPYAKFAHLKHTYYTIKTHLI
ncbi:9979_t:CDS:2 [Entrophospora sp. SA101]|nr:9979_t:CDS:2 [Entrophospora sp. SA101]